MGVTITDNKGFCQESFSKYRFQADIFLVTHFRTQKTMHSTSFSYLASFLVDFILFSNRIYAKAIVFLSISSICSSKCNFTILYLFNLTFNSFYFLLIHSYNDLFIKLFYISISQYPINLLILICRSNYFFFLIACPTIIF